MAKKIETVEIAKLQTNLFVRTCLNQDHAMMLGLAMEHGERLPPIQVTREFVVIDGRHRIEAHLLNSCKAIECEIIDVTDETELIRLAYRANAKSSLPPTQDDTEHTVALLLERKVTMKRIGELLALPASLARTLVKHVESKIMRKKVAKAIALVANGKYTTEQAAAEVGVPLGAVQDAMTPPKNRKRHSDAGEIQRSITRLGRSTARKYSALLQELLKKVEDGDITVKAAAQIFQHVERLHRANSRSTAGWKARFEVANGLKKSAAA